MYNIIIVDFDYNSEKNKWLKENRGIGFDEIISAISEGRVLENIKNPNSKKYSNQRMLVIRVGSYAFAVPYVIDKVRKVTFLKTCWPSREFTRKYIKNDK